MSHSFLHMKKVINVLLMRKVFLHFIKPGGLTLLSILLSIQFIFANGNYMVNAAMGETHVNDVQQQKTITGKVTDDLGDPLSGVSIMVKNSYTGIMSDADGNYSLAVPNNDAILVFTYIGFTTQEIQVGSQTVINVSMKESLQLLEEVVVVGYGTMRKKDLTGSVSSVNSQSLQAEMPRTVQDLLKGNITGLDVGYSSSAQGGGELLIRGRNSLNASRTPLLVVDGIIFQGALTDINP